MIFDKSLKLSSLIYFIGSYCVLTMFQEFSVKKQIREFIIILRTSQSNEREMRKQLL